MASADKPLNTDVPEKDVFALHFLQSLSNLRRQHTFNSPDKTNHRVNKIKKAAYVSMARAAGGTNRLWSRALLRRAAKENNRVVGLSRRNKRVTWLRRRSNNRRDPLEEKDAERLRNLVPGGGAMETSKLMEETAHYIKCLSMQLGKAVFESLKCVLGVRSCRLFTLSNKLKKFTISPTANPSRNSCLVLSNGMKWGLCVAVL
ncbi:unnamed protein product [Eruca vesicaria subsp. sativa]|uniref:IBH1-like N-terminal domain-containing protein n=1 Tax=Eruca vesicaria subsp. sativa TaxID=29727 RepID=A0ABC8M0W5_ERUVS|nr:unnamed protein product [Eruca vesicaria subsp. sativa]